MRFEIHPLAHVKTVRVAPADTRDEPYLQTTIFSGMFDQPIHSFTARV
jgi:hypothetical protein